ncbi:MAG TPA: inositol monophosphatase family protein [Gemmataceae bacterium]|jgi:myo-inositol-1(or 4)-monophosphatase|nr:inositol monophosphatase family protein [Gemmataceae bacterium]
MSIVDLSEYLDAAQAAARRAAGILESWRKRFSVREKGRADLVTEADVASQHAVREMLLGRFPGHEFLGEEGGHRPQRGPGSPPTWIVDPLDGTTNYVHDCPLYCVSIGLELDGELVVGVVYDPRQNEMFTAKKGAGATLNGQPLRTSSTAELGTSLLATGFPADLRGHERQLDWFRYFSLRAQSVRRTGSTALNLAYVAAGRFDGYWGFSNNPWDVAGAVVVIREAGGTVTAMDGGPYDHHGGECLASNGPLHPALLAAMREGPG